MHGSSGPHTSSLDRLAVADLDRSSSTNFAFVPTPSQRRVMAREIGALALPRLRLNGRIIPHQETDWLLRAHLIATANQRCVVSLNSVKTRLSVDVERRFIADRSVALPTGNCPMLDDDTIEPLEREIDLGAIAREVLVLELPLYPRAGGASPPPTPQAAHIDNPSPFAPLAQLRCNLPLDKPTS